MINTINEKYQLKYFNFLSMLYITSLLSAVVVVYKIVAIGPLVISLGTIIFPLTYYFGDVIAEVYGYKLSRQLIWFSLLCECIFTIMVTFIIKIPSPHYWNHQPAYNFVLGNLLHVSLANILAVPVGSFINIYVITKWKIVAHGRHFWIRSLGSTAFGEAAFCLIASPTVFLGYLPFNKVMEIVLSTYFVKVVFALISVYPAVLLVKFLKSKEGVDIYDHYTNFNPFKLSLADRNKLGIQGVVPDPVNMVEK